MGVLLPLALIDSECRQAAGDRPPGRDGIHGGGCRRC
jgi:hypothetical protein